MTFVGAHVLGHGDGGEPESAGALDDHGGAVADLAENEALGRRAHGAVDGAEHLIVDLVGDAVERALGVDVEVVGVGADEVGPLADARRRAPLADAEVGLAVEAHAAAPAVRPQAVDDAVAFLDGDAGGVRRHSLAQLVDDAGALVAHGAARRRERPAGGVAAPDVEVGAADAGLGDLEEDVAGLRVGDVVLGNLERLAVLLQNDDTALHALPPRVAPPGILAEARGRRLWSRARAPTRGAPTGRAAARSTSPSRGPWRVRRSFAGSSRCAPRPPAHVRTAARSPR